MSYLFNSIYKKEVEGGYLCFMGVYVLLLAKTNIAYDEMQYACILHFSKYSGYDREMSTKSDYFLILKSMNAALYLEMHPKVICACNIHNEVIGFWTVGNGTEFELGGSRSESQSGQVCIVIDGKSKYM